VKIPKSAFAAALLLFALPGAGRADFLYVATTGGEIHAFDVGSAGLTPVAGTPLALGSTARAVTIAPPGPFVYVIGAFPDQVAGFVVNRSDGSLTPMAGSPFPTTGGGPIAATTAPLGRFLYVGNNVSQDVSAYVIAPSGELTPVAGEPFPVVGVIGARSLAADPLGRFLYVTTGAITGTFSVFRINSVSGALTHVPGSPFGLTPGANTVAPDPSGRFVYVVNETTEAVSAYAVNGATGAISAVPGSPWPARPRPLTVTVHPNGEFVFVGNFPGLVSAFSVNAITGALTPVSGSPFATGPQPNALQVVAGQLFVAEAQGSGPPDGVGAVWGHAIDTVTGQLSLVPGSPFAAGRQPWALAALQTVGLPIGCGTIKGNGSLSTNARARFRMNVTVARRTGRPSGSLFYTDTDTSLRFTSRKIERVVFSGGQAKILGSGRANGQDVSFEADAIDGPPDAFVFHLSTGYTAAGAVTRSRITIGRCAAPRAVLDDAADEADEGEAEEP
jgi:6-phosphogluconolactonase